MCTLKNNKKKAYIFPNKNRDKACYVILVTSFC